MNANSSEILLPVTPEEAWEAVTDPDQLGEWLGDAAELDLRPGGDLAIEVAGEGERRGFIEEVEAPRRLVFWWSSEEAEASRVEIELEPEPGGTRVRVVESRPLAILDARGIEIGSWLAGPAGEPPAAPPELRSRVLALAG